MYNKYIFTPINFTQYINGELKTAAAPQTESEFDMISKAIGPDERHAGTALMAA